MVSVPGTVAGSQFCFQNRAFLMSFAQNCKIEDDFDLSGDISESPDFIFARKRHKTAAASALNNNNNKENQHPQ